MNKQFIDAITSDKEWIQWAKKTYPGFEFYITHPPVDLEDNGVVKVKELTDGRFLIGTKIGKRTGHFRNTNIEDYRYGKIK